VRANNILHAEDIILMLLQEKQEPVADR